MNHAVQDRRFALCLSGGGLRATLFHLGVIRALRVAGDDGSRPIDRLAEVYAVSGGSILAAYMMAHWDRITGDADQFAEAERAIIDLCGSGLRDKVLRRAVTQRLWDALFFLWPTQIAPAWLGKSVARPRRAHWLTEHYRTLFADTMATDCAARFAALPRFHIMATSFRSAELCAFTNEGFEIERRDGTFEAGPPCPIPLAAAVAASSAFPPLFPPLSFPAGILHDPADVRADGTILLSDGGIYDNLGAEKYRCRRGRDRVGVPPHLVISDAGAAFRNDDTASFADVFGRNMRASDVLMDRVARATKQDMNDLTDIVDLVISIHPAPDDAAGPAAGVRELYGRVRTDLDRFDADLSHLLVEWGEAAGRKALAADHGIVSGYPGGGAEGGGVVPDAIQSAVLAAAAKRDLRSFLSVRGDVGWSWALRGTIFALVFLGVVVPIGAIVGTVTTLVQTAREDERKAANADASAKRDALIASYNTVYGEIAVATVDNDLSSIRRILARERADLFAKTVAVQEGVAVVDGVPVVAPTTTVPPPDPAATVTYPQRVFIQFAGSYTREQIAALNADLRAAGWDMQSASGERTEKAWRLNQVRFGDGGGPAAEALAKALNASTAAPVDGVRAIPMRIVGNRNLEVWISN